MLDEFIVFFDLKSVVFIFKFLKGSAYPAYFYLELDDYYVIHFCVIRNFTLDYILSLTFNILFVHLDSDDCSLVKPKSKSATNTTRVM